MRWSSLSEAYPDIDRLVKEIPRRTGIRLRYTALGHAQRGADVSHRDRSIARDMSRIAWRAFKDGGANGLVVLRDGSLSLQQGSFAEPGEAAAQPRPVRVHQPAMSRYLAIDFGGTRSRAALFDDELRLIRRAETLSRVSDGPDIVLDRLIALGKSLTRR